MPKTHVVFYQEEDGAAPVLDWLDELPPKALDKCRIRIDAALMRKRRFEQDPERHTYEEA